MNKYPMVKAVFTEFNGGAENAGPENAGPENDGPIFLVNAGPENDGPEHCKACA